MRLVIDDVPKVMTAQGAYGGELEHATLSWTDTLPKGKHTIKVQWRNPDYASQQLMVSKQGATRNLIVVEL